MLWDQRSVTELGMVQNGRGLRVLEMGSVQWPCAIEIEMCGPNGKRRAQDHCKGHTECSGQRIRISQSGTEFLSDATEPFSTGHVLRLNIPFTDGLIA